MFFKEQIVREENGKEKGYQIEYGYRIYNLENMASKVSEFVEYDGACLCAIHFAALKMGDSIRLGVLAHHALKEANRLLEIPDFGYYTMADGIAMLLSRLGEWKQKSRAGKPEEESTQGNLFAFH